MNNLSDFLRSVAGRSAIRIWLIAVLFTGSLAMFLFSAIAQTANDNTCIVCHKTFTTLTLTCNSIDYRRHKDHGDPDGACAASSGSQQ